MPFAVHLWRRGAWLAVSRGQLAGFAFWPWMGFRFSIDSNESFVFHAAIEAAGRYLHNSGNASVGKRGFSSDSGCWRIKEWRN
ncbi:hypothetical protein [Delftia sp. JD2]|uniref:hypothetical protein n=1 Tax=Delftia sp. JD2 TaxID=469553 RepID=UPI001111F17D|nr:hypothetical protein [Delftia sp. JD2]